MLKLLNTSCQLGFAESVLQAAKRARLEARKTDALTPSTPSQINPFRKTCEQKLLARNLAPLRIQRHLANFQRRTPFSKSPSRAAVENPKKVHERTNSIQ